MATETVELAHDYPSATLSKRQGHWGVSFGKLTHPQTTPDHSQTTPRPPPNQHLFFQKSSTLLLFVIVCFCFHRHCDITACSGAPFVNFPSPQHSLPAQSNLSRFPPSPLLCLHSLSPAPRPPRFGHRLSCFKQTKEPNESALSNLFRDTLF
jgi:hypothetical protein